MADYPWKWAEKGYFVTNLWPFSHFFKSGRKIQFIYLINRKIYHIQKDFPTSNFKWLNYGKKFFSILFAIRESKARKSGKAPIEITITVNGERCTLSTGKQVPIDKWDKAKQQVKGKDEEAQSLNNYLKAIKAKLYQKEAELLDRGFIITAELLRDAYFDKVESLKEKSLFEVFAEHNKEQEKLVGNGVSKATYWISVYTVRLLKEFVQQKNLQNWKSAKLNQLPYKIIL